MAIDTVDRDTQWPAWAETTVPLSRPAIPMAHAAPDDLLPERLATVGAEDAAAPLSIGGILMAWRAADRALAELAEGTPEWAAVNATIISLRASYRARFDEYVERTSP